MPQRKISVVTVAGLVGMSMVLPAQAQKTKHKPELGAVWASQFGGTIRVLFGTVPLPVSSSSRLPYRDARDSAICVAPESLTALGIVATVEGGSVKLVGSDRNLIMVAARQGPFERSGGVFVDVVEVLKTMGVATLTYEPSTTTLTLRAVLREVALQGDSLRVSAGLPIAPKITTENQGLRVFIDFPGTTIAELPPALELSSAKVASVRATQLDENTARLTLELPEPLALNWREGKAATVATLTPPGAPVTIASPVVAPKPATSASKAPPPMVFRSVSATPLSDERLRFTLETSRLAAVRPSVQKDTLTLDFGNIYLADSAKAGAATLAGVQHPLIKSAQLVPVGANAARLVIELASRVGYTIKHSKGGGLLLELLTPRKTEGPLVGKTIVVDPGHGGSSTGNPGHDGILERTLTLPMALSLAQTLEELGANVILTRESNFDPGLEERALIANRAGADLFVSVHCNDGSSNHTIRGAEVYYHASEPISQDVAKFIADKVRQGVSAIPVRGVLSDYRIYPGDGFAVLRHSQMAGVLVETGYMSNSADYAALKNKDVQTQMGVAIAQGIADFFAANPDSLATRYAKPQPQRDYGFPPRLTFPENDTSDSPVK
ncbi:N-acetylmuramoyl-L-alanine amidase [Armatimonas sp.]|uniref:N-acetylmuramoyl-L-alanine amidase n=1 Tax=Armatimonas sp. TaxID=1872638 RepID=UPI003752E034